MGEGGRSLVVSSIGVSSGTSFSVSAASLPWMIGPLKSSPPVRVTFSPTNTGASQGSLIIVSDDQNERQTQVTLYGAGL